MSFHSLRSLFSSNITHLCEIRFDTYMSDIWLLDSRIVHKVISECDKMNGHIGDTTYVSYCGVYQNLMYLSSKCTGKIETNQTE